MILTQSLISPRPPSAPPASLAFLVGPPWPSLQRIPLRRSPRTQRDSLLLDALQSPRYSSGRCNRDTRPSTALPYTGRRGADHSTVVEMPRINPATGALGPVTSSWCTMTGLSVRCWKIDRRTQSLEVRPHSRQQTEDISTVKAQRRPSQGTAALPPSELPALLKPPPASVEADGNSQDPLISIEWASRVPAGAQRPAGQLGDYLVLSSQLDNDAHPMTAPHGCSGDAARADVHASLHAGHHLDSQPREAQSVQAARDVTPATTASHRTLVRLAAGQPLLLHSTTAAGVACNQFGVVAETGRHVTLAGVQVGLEYEQCVQTVLPCSHLPNGWDGQLLPVAIHRANMTIVESVCEIFHAELRLKTQLASDMEDRMKVRGPPLRRAPLLTSVSATMCPFSSPPG